MSNAAQHSPVPTMMELYLAFRQAKTALFYERSGVGLLALASFEANLAKNLKQLQLVLRQHPWFDGVDPGRVWVVPKRLGPAPVSEEDILYIGDSYAKAKRRLDVQFRLSPTPEFAIVEVLYLRQFGALLDQMLSDNVVGYRLDLRDGHLDPHRRWVFQYWPRAYQEFRSVPLKFARWQLTEGPCETTIMSADLASFYDTVHPKFLLSSLFTAHLPRAHRLRSQSFKLATTSLLKAYDRFRMQAGRILGMQMPTGIPIGALTSRVVANVALASLDAHIEAQPHVVAYRRYVDDIVLVSSMASGTTRDDVASQMLPLVATNDDTLRFDVNALRRPGCEFHLQRRKLCVHRLSGAPGTDFVKAVQSDFDRIVSRSKEFIDISALRDGTGTSLLRGRTAAGSPLRVLRDADRAELERLALATNLRTLERASKMVDPKEVSAVVRATLEVANRAMTLEDNWVEDLNGTLRLQQLALATNDWASCRDINKRMNAVFGDLGRLHKGISTLCYRGRNLDPQRKLPWQRLRDYLHVRRQEACVSSLRCDVAVSDLGKGFPQGLIVGPRPVGPKALLLAARRLAAVDLRSFDREDDLSSRRKNPTTHGPLDRVLRKDPDFAERLDSISTFVQQLSQNDPWRMTPASLFLCTRPPSYFDVASRLLSEAETKGLDDDELQQTLRVINAIRGTNYTRPAGRCLGSGVIELEPHTQVAADPGAEGGVRLVLGNLMVEEAHFRAAAKGAPQRTIARLIGLQRVLERAERAARRARRGPSRRPTLLLLPELSVPRAWLRAIATHVVRHGEFGTVLGLEYERKADCVLNQAIAVLPGRFASVVTLTWTKRQPAPHEAEELTKMRLSYAQVQNANQRLVIQTDWGRFSVLICSELLETQRVSDLFGRVHLVLCPSWNTDTASYDHLIQSVGFQLHAAVAIANNAAYSDSRAWAPYTKRWMRDLCRLVERGTNDTVHVDLPIHRLVAFHQEAVKGAKMSGGSKKKGKPRVPEFRPMPPGLIEATRKLEIELDPHKVWTWGADDDLR